MAFKFGTSAQLKFVSKHDKEKVKTILWVKPLSKGEVDDHAVKIAELEGS